MAPNYNQQVKQYLKKNETNLYGEYKSSLNNSVALVNQVVRHYQWIFEIQDFTYLDLQDRANKNYLNLFMYGLEQSEELANDFINYFVFSFRNAYNVETKKWSLDLIFNTFIHQASYHEFDLIAMYALIGATYDRFPKFFPHLKINPKLSMGLEQVIDFFELIVNQDFYNELKAEILNKRKNSYYFKKPDIEVHFPEDRIMDPKVRYPWWKVSKWFKAKKPVGMSPARQLELLKQAQSNAETEFEKWDELALDPNIADASINDVNVNKNIDINHQQQPSGTEREIEVPNILKQDEENTTPKFQPRPDVKMIKIGNRHN